MTCWRPRTANATRWQRSSSARRGRRSRPCQRHRPLVPGPEAHPVAGGPGRAEAGPCAKGTLSHQHMTGQGRAEGGSGGSPRNRQISRGTDDDIVNQIKSRVSLLDLVQQHIRLRKQGREYTGLCPFHQEKTPSFWVNEQMQSWYCFGCQRGGDVIRFQELIEKTDFRGALDTLAELAGVERKQESGAQKERTALRRRILEMNRLAQQYYEYVLWSTPAGEPGRRLLGRRDVNEELARRFGLGYAPGGANFASFLQKRGHKLGDAAAAGLVRSDNQDFFGERVLIPIRDERGSPLAFTGRTVSAEDPRKYVNTRETPAYVKGRVLFALDVARQGISDLGHAVLMEGQFDVIVGHRFGVTN